MRSTLMKIAAIALVGGTLAAVGVTTGPSEAEAGFCNPDAYPDCSEFQGDRCLPGVTNDARCWLNAAYCEPAICICQPNGTYLCF